MFTSNRERRLWLFALAVVVAIYSTVGLAGTLAEVLGDRDRMGDLLFSVWVVLMLAIVGSGLMRRPGRMEIWVALGIAAVYAMAFVRMGLDGAERTHLFEYGMLAILIHEALFERWGDRRVVLVPAVAAVAVASFLGLVDESIQAFVPNRVFDPVDVGFNAFAASMAVVASVALAWAQGRVGRLVSRVR